MQHVYSILPFIETMQRLETEKLPVIHTKSFEFQHFVCQVQRLRSKMLLRTGSIKSLFEKNGLHLEEQSKSCTVQAVLQTTLIPHMVLSHLSICLPVCIWATWRGLNLHPSAPVVYAEQSCPVLFCPPCKYRHKLLVSCLQRCQPLDTARKKICPNITFVQNLLLVLRLVSTFPVSQQQRRFLSPSSLLLRVELQLLLLCKRPH